MNKTKWLFSCLMVGSLLQATCAFSSQANLKSVVTEGMGKDSHSAIQDAVKNALINVAGTFIDVDISIEQHKKIQDGLAEQTKNIRKEITEYSQGTVQSVDVINVNCAADGLCRATTKVFVRLDDLAVYVKKLASSKNTISEGMFAVVQSHYDNQGSKQHLIHKNVLDPLFSQKAYDLLIGRPMLPKDVIRSINLPLKLPFVDLRQKFKEELDDLQRQNPNKHILVFDAEIKLKDGYLDNAIKTLTSIGAKKVSLGKLIDLSNREELRNNKFAFSVNFGSLDPDFRPVYAAKPGPGASWRHYVVDDKFKENLSLNRNLNFVIKDANKNILFTANRQQYENFRLIGLIDPNLDFNEHLVSEELYAGWVGVFSQRMPFYIAVAVEPDVLRAASSVELFFEE